MKYIIINGSPRKKNTWKVVKQVMKNLDSEIEEVHLSKEKILMCNGCSKCIIDGENKCPHFDIINPITTALTHERIPSSIVTIFKFLFLNLSLNSKIYPPIIK